MTVYTIASILFVLTLASAKGGGARAGSELDSRATVAGSHALNRGSATDPAAYWHRLAQRRLYLLGKRERRIVVLLHKLRAGRRLDDGSHASSPARGASIRSIICTVFGSQCSKALSVAWCESKFNIYARNGQYLGIWQMGSYARAKYGHGWDAWTQTRAAHRYYLDAGWSPWTCA